MTLRATLAALSLLLVACPQSDVGRPCNHGAAFVPQGQTITFGSLACDNLLCVYAEDVTPPQGECTDNADCNPEGTTSEFRCEQGECILDQTYVLDRSMCSRSCETDVDCADSEDGTHCARGFACARIQALGSHCCEKLCVCRDDLDEATAAQLETACSADALDGCCDKTPHPDACGG